MLYSYSVPYLQVILSAKLPNMIGSMTESEFNQFSVLEWMSFWANWVVSTLSLNIKVELNSSMISYKYLQDCNSFPIDCKFLAKIPQT